MRQHQRLLNRCLSGVWRTTAPLLAPATNRRTTTAAAVAEASSSAEDTASSSADIGHAAQRARRTGGRRPSSRGRSPAQLLADLGVPSTPGGKSTHKGKGDVAEVSKEAHDSVGAVNPVELLLRKHRVRHGGGGGGDDNDGGDDERGGNGGGSGRSTRREATRAKVMEGLIEPPPKAETVTRRRPRRPDALSSQAVAASEDEEGAEAVTLHPPRAATAVASPKAVLAMWKAEELEEAAAAAQSDDRDGLQLLTNPFRGLHTVLARSYRIDQLLQDSTPEDMLLARQERKSTAFSFIQLRHGEAFFDGHWASLPEMQQQLDSTVADSNINSRTGSTSAKSGRGITKASASSSPLNVKGGAPYVRGTPVPGLTLFNNDLGLGNPMVQCSYPLIVAQRLLLFPDHLRHFHTICGRENVPCDFYADIDLPGDSQVSGESMLLEVLNYLEVRLPGIGFTNPFFLVLTNATPSSDKVSFHVHARSMTYSRDEQQRAEQQLEIDELQKRFKQRTEGKKALSTGKSKKKTRMSKKVKAATKSGLSEVELDLMEEEGAHAMEEEEDDDYDDLSDMVNVVDNTDILTKKSKTAIKLIAFQDYRTVKLIADEVNQTVGRDVVDTNCYRPNGMLRCAFSSKLPSTQDHDYAAAVMLERKAAQSGKAYNATSAKRLVPLITAKDTALRKRLSEMESALREMSDPEILEMTFCTRHTEHDVKVLRKLHEHAKTLAHASAMDPLNGGASSEEQQLRMAEVIQSTMRHRFKLIRPRHILGPSVEQAMEFDAYGNAVTPFMTEAAKWRRYKTAVSKVHSLPPRAAANYDVWVRVGLALHNFSNEDNVFEEWVLFSLKAPQKYSREVCRRKWVQFERNPDALNWRRGYNYLNNTVWRQL